MSQTTQKTWEIDELIPPIDPDMPLEGQIIPQDTQVQPEPSTDSVRTEPHQKRKLPAWFTSTWDIKQIAKENYMFFLIVAIAFGVGWLVASSYYQNQLVAAYNKAVDALPSCVDPLIKAIN